MSYGNLFILASMFFNGGDLDNGEIKDGGRVKIHREAFK